MRTVRRSPWMLLAATCAALLLLPLSAPPAEAKLSSKEWKAVQEEYKKLFPTPRSKDGSIHVSGDAEAKLKLIAKIESDKGKGDEPSGRALRLLKDILFKQVEVLSVLTAEQVNLSGEQSALTQRGRKGFTATDEALSKELDEKAKEVTRLLAEEQKATDAIVTKVSAGPLVLRKNILSTAKTSKLWPVRAAAVRIAVGDLEEKNSWAYVLQMLRKDMDPRVRMAALEAVAGAAEGKGEALVIGRLADADWSVVLRASQIATEKKMHKAVPHMINALTGASPRLAEGLGKALRELTGENFDPYADVWSRWWADNKAEFEKDVEVKTGKKPEFPRIHFYGVEIKSDRVLFIIDVSGSMKKETKNDNPKDRWKPPPTVTGPGKPPPPPPPPEEILSGPKIDVAKHELKKAIEKLPKGSTFNIIVFNQGAVAWQKAMVKASKKNKESAFAWIRAQKPSGSTFTLGALEMAFQIAGLINYDEKYPEIKLDTIVLLSDGAPTERLGDAKANVSKLMPFTVILEKVREWNARKQVVIHCIAVDMQPGNEFMKKLAEENGGTFVDR